MNFKLRLQSRRETFYSFNSGLYFHILPSSRYWSHGPLVAWFASILSRRLVTMLSNTSFFTLHPLVRNITLSLSSVSVPDKKPTISTHFRGGFRIPRRRGRHPFRRGRQNTNMPDFPQKLHEIKKILVHGGGRRGRPPWILHWNLIYCNIIFMRFVFWDIRRLWIAYQDNALMYYRFKMSRLGTKQKLLCCAM